MEDTIVSFKIAKLAKKKGFGLGENDYCQLLYFYNLEGKLNDIKDNLFLFKNTSASHLGALTLSDIEIEISFMDNSIDEIILAPTQSLLQKWFRDVHKIHIQINWYADGTYKASLISDVFEDEENDVSFFNTFEECLEDALFEALNCI